VLSHRSASVLDMDIIVGTLIWGGLLVLVSRWLMRSYRGRSPRAPVTPTQPTQPTAPSAKPSIAPAAVEESAREAGALVDGLIIGHYLTRGHYQDRLDEQAETIDGLRAEVAADTYFGDDDLDDFDDANDLGGYGTVGFADGFEEAEADDLDGLGAAGNPWDDDVFGHDEDD
jgi:hypothetical protein